MLKFQGLIIPEIISSSYEFPGDWMFIVQILMRCHLLTTTRVIDNNKEAANGPGGTSSDESLEVPSDKISLRHLMNIIMQRVSFPPHSLLLEVLDTWLDVTVNGTGSDDGSGGQMAPPIMTDMVSGSTSSSSANGSSRDSIPFLPSEIRELTSTLQGFVSPALMRLYRLLQDQESNMRQSMPSVDSIITSYGSIDLSTTFRTATALSSDAGEAPLMTDSELLALSRSDMNGDSKPAQCGIVEFSDQLAESLSEFGSQAFRAAVACYVSLRYQRTCLRSARAGYTCVFFCEPHDLPVKRCISTFIIAVRFLSGNYGQSVSLPYPSRCADKFLSSFINLLKKCCPEVLLRERLTGLLACYQYIDLLPESSPQVTGTTATRQIVTTDELLDILKYPSQESIAVKLLMQSSINVTRECHTVVNAVLTILRTAINQMQKDISDKETFSTLSRSLFGLWKMLHALHPRASLLELDTFNCLLELGDVRRPRGISSYAILVQEPILLFRLPVRLLRIPLIMQIALFIFRSLLVASRVDANERLQTIQLKAQGGVVTGNSRSLLAAHTQIDNSEYSTLQEVICIRLLFELWNSICSKKQQDAFICFDIAELGHVIVSQLTIMLSENVPLLDVLLFYGIRYWSCFVLLSQSECILSAVVNSLLQFMSTAVEHISKADAPSPLWSPKYVELLLLHISFLLRSTASGNPSRELMHAVDFAVEGFYRYVKKSSKQACWKQPASQSSLGHLLCEILQILGAEHPQVSLRIIFCFTKPDLVQSCPSTSVLVDMQNRLENLKGKICGGAVQLTIQKRIRSSSELREGDGLEGMFASVVAEDGYDLGQEGPSAAEMEHALGTISSRGSRKSRRLE